MRKSSLLLAAGIGLSCVYFMSYAQVPSAPTDSTSINHSIFDLATPRMLSPTVMEPDATARSLIQQGTFTSNAAYQCPTNPQCGGPGMPNPGPCPDVCWVAAAVVGVPPWQRPYNYPVCPKGYSAIYTGDTDLKYESNPADPIIAIPRNEAEMLRYEATGYDCNWVWGGVIRRSFCPNNTLPGSYLSTGAEVVLIDTTSCRSSAGGASYCNWSVACGSTVNRAEGWRIGCFRFPGWHPVAAPFAGSTTSLQHAPTSVVCGRVTSEWIDAF